MPAFDETLAKETLIRVAVYEYKNRRRDLEALPPVSVRPSGGKKRADVKAARRVAPKALSFRREKYPRTPNPRKDGHEATEQGQSPRKRRNRKRLDEIDS